MAILRPLMLSGLFFGGGLRTRSRILLGLLVLFIVTSVAVFLFLRYQIRKSFPVIEGTLSVVSLHESVEVFRDEFGVPVIQAKNEHDLMVALGFVHAQDRLWQMDLARRAGEGRLSEIFGAVTVPFDRMFRIVGIARVALEVDRSMTDESRNRLQWYADGVNNFVELHQGKLPVEFDMLRYEPDPWLPRHSLIIAQMMAWELNMAWWTDLTLGAIAGKVGLEKAMDIFPAYPPTVPPTVAGNVLQQVGGPAREILSVAEEYKRFTGTEGVSAGSNAWAIAPSMSASRRVILANDPHLHLQLPSKWYQVHLRGGSYDVGGMSIPGVPGIVVGRNRAIAWGVTNMMADEADFYVEQIDSIDMTRYFYEGKWLQMEIRNEEIPVRGDSAVTLTIRSTHHGPIVTDIHTSLQKSILPFVASMRWTGYEISDRIEVFNKINRAGNWGEFRDALRGFSGPGQNFVYGDSAGNIGYWCGVRLPIRGQQSSTLPLPGWNKAAEWRGFVPFDQLPHLYNPPEGYIATANNKIASESYPYYISDLWEPPSRIQRLREVLGSEAPFAAEDFERLQNDMLSVFARDMLPFLLRACEGGVEGMSDSARVFEYLRNWDFRFSREDIATSIFQETFVRLLTNIYADEMGEDLLHDFVILGNIPLRVTAALIRDGSSPWFDDVNTEEVETDRDIIRKSLREAVLALSEQLGGDMRRWQWGELHSLALHHPFGLRKPLDKVFDVGPFPAPGGPTALVSGEYSFNKPFEVSVGASFRMIVDFAQPNELRSILPSGQSGQVFHDHYADQTHLWLNGGYRMFTSDPAASQGWNRLMLEPAQ